jgi:hypothetical protein
LIGIKAQEFSRSQMQSRGHVQQVKTANTRRLCACPSNAGKLETERSDGTHKAEAGRGATLPASRQRTGPPPAN